MKGQEKVREYLRSERLHTLHRSLFIAENCHLYHGSPAAFLQNKIIIIISEEIMKLTIREMKC